MTIDMVNLEKFVGGQAEWRDNLRHSLFQYAIAEICLKEAVGCRFIDLVLVEDEGDGRRRAIIDLSEYPRIEEVADAALTTIRLGRYMAGQFVILTAPSEVEGVVCPD